MRVCMCGYDLGVFFGLLVFKGHLFRIFTAIGPFARFFYQQKYSSSFSSFIISASSQDMMIEGCVSSKPIPCEEWTFIFDSSTLDGTAVPGLRSIFRQWTKHEPSVENPYATHSTPKQLTPHCPSSKSRYRFFIKVDEPSLRGVIEAKSPDHWHNGELLIDAYWEPIPEDSLQWQIPR